MDLSSPGARTIHPPAHAAATHARTGSDAVVLVEGFIEDAASIKPSTIEQHLISAYT